METNPSAVIITYGELQSPALRSFIVADLARAKELALTFIKVIPDDLDWYVTTIGAWTGEGALVITHQDDDAFFFSAAPVHGCFVDPAEDVSEFTSFVAEYNAEPY